MAASERMFKRGTDKAKEFYFSLLKEVERWPQLTVSEIASVLATQSDPCAQVIELRRLESGEKLEAPPKQAEAPEKAQPAGQFKLVNKSAEITPPPPKKAVPMKDRLGVARGRVEKHRVDRNKNSGVFFPYWRHEDGSRYYLVGDSQMVRLAGMLKLRVDRDRKGNLCSGPLAVSGASIDRICSTLEQWSISRAIVLVGINDLLTAGKTLEGCVDQMERLVAYLSANCDTAIVANLPPCPRYGTDHEIHNKIKSFNEALEHCCDGLPNIRLIDLHRACHTSEGQVNSLLFEKNKYNGQVDRLHLSQLGLNKMINLACIQ